MMTSAASPAGWRLTKLAPGTLFSGHDVGQLMKTSMLARADAQPVPRADLHLSQTWIGPAHATTAHNGHRVGMCCERGPEPLRLLDGMDVGRALPMAYRSARVQQYRAGKLADRQTRRQLCVVRGFL